MDSSSSALSCSSAARPAAAEAATNFNLSEPNTMNRVVITAMGWITPMGHTLEGVWKRLLNGESGIAKTSIFDASTFPTTFSAEVKDYDLADHIGEKAKEHETGGRNSKFALGACAQAWKMAGLDAAKLDLDRVGIYLGSGEGSLDFEAYTGAALAAWKPDTATIDSVKWAEIATEYMNVTRELEQEPNMP